MQRALALGKALAVPSDQKCFLSQAAVGPLVALLVWQARSALLALQARLVQLALQAVLGQWVSPARAMRLVLLARFGQRVLPT